MASIKLADHTSSQHLIPKSSSFIETFIYSVYGRMVSATTISNRMTNFLLITSFIQNCLIMYLVAYPNISEFLNEESNHSRLWLIGFRKIASLLSPVNES